MRATQWFDCSIVIEALQVIQQTVFQNLLCGFSLSSGTKSNGNYDLNGFFGNGGYEGENAHPVVDYSIKVINY